MTPRAITITIGASTSRRTSLGGSNSAHSLQEQGDSRVGAGRCDGAADVASTPRDQNLHRPSPYMSIGSTCRLRVTLITVSAQTGRLYAVHPTRRSSMRCPRVPVVGGAPTPEARHSKARGARHICR